MPCTGRSTSGASLAGFAPVQAGVVRRAWRVTWPVTVRLPGFRRAEGKEKGVVARSGPKEVQSEIARPGILRLALTAPRIAQDPA